MRADQKYESVARLDGRSDSGVEVAGGGQALLVEEDVMFGRQQRQLHLVGHVVVFGRIRKE